MVGDFLLAFLLAGGGLLALFLHSARKDRAEADRRQAAADAQIKQAQDAAAEDARKYQPGVRLLCLGCETRFRGPLSDSGCPHCRLLSLVVTEDSTRLL